MTLLPVDNCYSEASAGYPDVDYTPPESPSARFKNMSDAILAINRTMLFQICEWGVDFPSLWAPAIGNSWRIANDISNNYHSIWRVLNQVVPQTSFAGEVASFLAWARDGRIVRAMGCLLKAGVWRMEVRVGMIV
jgi:alpha-galactosidase